MSRSVCYPFPASSGISYCPIKDKMFIKNRKESASMILKPFGHQNQLECLLKHRFLCSQNSRVSDSGVDLGIFLSNKSPNDAKAVGLGTILGESLLYIFNLLLEHSCFNWNLTICCSFCKLTTVHTPSLWFYLSIYSFWPRF